MTQPQEQALCPEDVLRDLERVDCSWSEVGELCARAATLIRQMQAAIVEADRRARTSQRNIPKGMSLLEWISEPLAPFLPKPDKLAEAMRQALPASMPDHHVAAIVRNLNAYCVKHGGTITWKDGE